MRQPCDRHDDRYQRHSDDGTLFCTVCEIERLRADLTRVLDMLRRAYVAMRSEYRRTGHIGHGDEHHDEY